MFNLPPPIKLQTSDAMFLVPPTIVEPGQDAKLHDPPPIKLQAPDEVFKVPPTKVDI